MSEWSATGTQRSEAEQREELSLSATKSIKKEFVDIVISFN